MKEEEGMFGNLWVPIVYLVLTIIGIIQFIRFVLKKKRGSMIVTIFIAVFFFGSGAIYGIPHNIINIDAEDISRIEVSETTVSDKEMIKENI